MAMIKGQRGEECGRGGWPSGQLTGGASSQSSAESSHAFNSRVGVAYARKSSSVPENGNRPERSGIGRLHGSTSSKEYSNVYSLDYPFYVVDVNNLLWSKPESCDSLAFKR